MAEKRRVSTRLRTEKVLDKFDEPPKKRVQTRSTRDTPTKSKRASAAKSEPKPPKIVHKYGLPLTKEFDPSLLEALDSIAASGVLTASLQASKTRWITEGIFERYWVKPVGKKKAQQEQPSNNPPKESMVKIGPCVVTIQPHAFEATLYSIRDPTKSGKGAKANSSLQTQSQPQQQYQYVSSHQQTPRPEQQHQVQQQFSSSSTPQRPPSTQASNTSTPSRGVQFVNQSSFPTPAGQNQTTHSHPPQVPAQVSQQATTSQPAPPPKSQAQSQAQQTPTTTAPIPIQPSSQVSSPAQPTQTTQSSSKSNHDPVIQMLAQRASTDPKLKALMKVVASGTANTEELKVFQSHIDELTAIIARQNALTARNNASAAQVAQQPQKQQQSTQPSQQPPTPTQSRPLPNGQLQQTASSNTQQQSQQSSPHPPQPRPHAPAQQQYSSPFRQVSYPTPPQPSKPRFHAAARNDIIGACLEFHSHSGDRFKFPKHSVLEVLPGNRSLLASLLVASKGVQSESGDYDPSKEYYQPVTMRIDASQEKIIDTLMRAVAPLGEVQRHMDDLMSRCSRAEHVQLSLTLPIEFPDPVEGDEEQPKLPSETVVASWKSLKDAAAKGPILAESKPVKGWKNKVEDWSQTCRFCYEQIERSQQVRIDDNRPICQDCMRLLGMSGKMLPNMSVRSKLPSKLHVGPESLMLDV